MPAWFGGATRIAKPTPGDFRKPSGRSGHYTIDSLIQKVKAVSARVFESDYLCLRPKAAGVWFTMFDEPLHVTDAAELRPASSGARGDRPGRSHRRGLVSGPAPSPTAAATRSISSPTTSPKGVSAESNAAAIRRRSEQLCGIGLSRARVSMDPSGNARTAVGPTVRGEYERAGCKGRDGLESWPSGKKVDGLNLVEALLKSADETTNLTIHPRCRHLISAMQSYTRAKRANQWMDYAEDPQHPHEDLIDPLCGGLKLLFPEGRAPAPSLRTVDARNC